MKSKIVLILLVVVIVFVSSILSLIPVASV